MTLKVNIWGREREREISNEESENEQKNSSLDCKQAEVEYSDSSRVWSALYEHTHTHKLSENVKRGRSVI